MMRLPRRILPVWIPLRKSAEVGQRYPTASSPSPGWSLCAVRLPLGQLESGRRGQEVQLVLDGLSIASQDGPALWVEQAEKVVVLLSDGTVNSLTDSLTYTLEDGKDRPTPVSTQKELSPSMERVPWMSQATTIMAFLQRHSLHYRRCLFILRLQMTGKGKAGVKILAADMTIPGQGDGIQSKLEDQDPSQGYVFIGGWDLPNYCRLGRNSG